MQFIILNNQTSYSLVKKEDILAVAFKLKQLDISNNLTNFYRDYIYIPQNNELLLKEDVLRHYLKVDILDFNYYFYEQTLTSKEKSKFLYSLNRLVSIVLEQEVILNSIFFNEDLKFIYNNDINNFWKLFSIGENSIDCPKDSEYEYIVTKYKELCLEKNNINNYLNIYIKKVYDFYLNMERKL